MTVLAHAFSNPSIRHTRCMPSDPDRDDLLACRDGGGRANLEALWQRHADGAWRLARWICGEQADDALQEAAMHLVRAAPQWRDQGPGSASGWLMTIVANAAFRQRRRGTRRWLPLEVVGELPAPIDPERDGERLERVRRGLERLAIRHRQPVELRYCAGLDFPAVAAALGVSERTARSRVTRGLARLRTLLGVPTGAGLAGVALLLTPASLPAAPPSIGNMIGRLPPEPLSTAAATGAATTLALKIAGVVLLAAIGIGGWHMAGPETGADAAPGADMPVDAKAVTVTPRDAEPWIAFDELRRRGGPSVVVLGREVRPLSLSVEIFTEPWSRRKLIVPAALRFRPVTAEVLITEVAALHGVHVTWLRGGHVAVLHPAVSESEIQRLLAGLAAADPAMRSAAATSSGRAKDPRLANALVKAAQDADPVVATAALAALREWRWDGVLTLDPTAIGLIRRELASPDRELRRAAATALGSLDEVQALPLITSALADPETAVRAKAASALGRIRGARAFALLEQVLRDEQARKPIAGQAAKPDSSVTVSALLALAAHGGERAVKQLEPACADPRVEVRGYALAALAVVAGERSLPFIEKALGDSDAQAQVGALLALGDVGGDKALAMLMQHPGSEFLKGEILGRMGGSKAMAILRAEAQRGPGQSGGIPPWEGLANIGSKEALTLLEQSVGTSEMQLASERSRSVLLLGNVGGDRALDLVGKALIDPADNVRAAAAMALARWHDSRVLTYIDQALASSDADIRRSAAWALVEVGSDEAVDRLATWHASEVDTAAFKAHCSRFGFHLDEALAAAEARRIARQAVDMPRPGNF